MNFVDVYSIFSIKYEIIHYENLLKKQFLKFFLIIKAYIYVNDKFWRKNMNKFQISLKG